MYFFIEIGILYVDKKTGEEYSDNKYSFELAHHKDENGYKSAMSAGAKFQNKRKNR